MILIGLAQPGFQVFRAVDRMPKQAHVPSAQRFGACAVLIHVMVHWNIPKCGGSVDWSVDFDLNRKSKTENR
jgi:hypothetical protein